MSAPQTTIARPIAQRTPVADGGFFAWLLKMLGWPAGGTPLPTISTRSDASLHEDDDNQPDGTYVLAPGGYRIRVPQPGEVHHGIDQMLPSVRDGLNLLPPLPHVVIELLREIQNPAATSASVSAIASNDPAMAASLIRTVNSAAFGLNRKVTSVADAVSYLGFSSVKSMVLQLQLEQMLGGGDANPDLQDLWVHSLMVSYIVDVLAKRVAGVDRGFVSTLGLLHDIGKLVILTQFEKEAQQLRAAGGEASRQSSLAEEQRLLGVNHADLGANVAAKWGLPADLVKAIRFHHIPEQAFEPTDPKALHQAAYLVQISNQLAKYCYAYADDVELDAIASDTLESLGFGPELASLLDPEVCAAASRAIFFAYERHAGATSVRRFLSLRRGEQAAALLASAAEIPAEAVRITIDDAVCESMFERRREIDRDSHGRWLVHDHGTATDKGIAALLADVQKHHDAIELPGEVRISLALTAMGMLANVPRDPHQQVEVVHLVNGDRVHLAVRAPGIRFAERYGPDVSPEIALAALAQELANILNLKWFQSISTSHDGGTVVFTAVAG